MTTLDEPALRRALDGCSWIDRLVVLDEIDSTNDEVRRLQADAKHGTVVVLADRQTAGRGRRGRPWRSPPGVGLYVSVGIPATGSATEAPRLTLAASVAACEACRDLGAPTVEIDWPNDLVCDGLKLGGILAELRTIAGRGELIVGTGLNVHHDRDTFEPELSGIATSLRLVTRGREPSREALAAEYLRRLGVVASSARSGGWPVVARRWAELAPGATGRRVRVGVARGVTAGIAADGALRVRLDDGTLREIRQADTVLADGGG